jgi:hypothetical protein
MEGPFESLRVGCLEPQGGQLRALGWVAASLRIGGNFGNPAFVRLGPAGPDSALSRPESALCHPELDSGSDPVMATWSKSKTLTDLPVRPELTRVRQLADPESSSG